MKLAPILLVFSALTLVACASSSEPDSTADSSSDLSSQPEKGAKGDACGTGFSGIERTCNPGLVCRFTPSVGAGDEMGECIDIVAGELGASCGAGVTGIEVECKKGFTCEESKSKARDALGTCVRDQ